VRRGCRRGAERDGRVAAEDHLLFADHQRLEQARDGERDGVVEAFGRVLAPGR
jgi:hypothetical protein